MCASFVSVAKLQYDQGNVPGVISVIIILIMLWLD